MRKIEFRSALFVAKHTTKRSTGPFLVSAKIYRERVRTMRNLKKEPLEKLQQELEQSEHRMEVEKRRMNLAEQQIKLIKRKARNHRLIVKGAEWEKAFPNTEVLNDEEFRVLLRNLSSNEEVMKIVREAVNQSVFFTERPAFGAEG